MVFARICERASSVFIFAITSSCQMFLVSREHFDYFVNFPPAGIFLLSIGYVVLRQVIANNLAHTSKTDQQHLADNFALGVMSNCVTQHRVSQWVDAPELQELSRRSTVSKARDLKFCSSF